MLDDLGYPTPPWRKSESSGESKEELEARLASMGPVVPKHQRPKKHHIKIGIILLVIVIVIGIDLLFLNNKGSTKHNTASTKSVTSTSHSSSSTTAKSVPTKSYVSSLFNLSFNYPENWAVVGGVSGPLTVTSPSMQLTSASGQKVNGLIIMTIQPQGQLPAKFSAGTAVAVLNSQLISYAQPTADQTSQTYLSFVQYSSTTTTGGLDGIYVTGNDGYQKDQVIPSTDIDSINPLITVTFTQCDNASCTANLNPLTIASSSWNNSSFQKPIVNMISSLTFN